MSKLLLVAWIRALVSPGSGIKRSKLSVVSWAIVAYAYKSKAKTSGVIIGLIHPRF
jgi:hypothetical protein